MPEPHMALAFVNGRAALTVTPFPLSAVAHLQRMEVEVPNLRVPVDLGATPERFRNRRCRLQAAVVSVDGERLPAILSAEALARAGITDASLVLGDGHVFVRARAAAGGRQAHFTARVFLAPATARRVRVSVEDIRLYGFLPVPAPLLGGAILGAAGLGTSAGNGTSSSVARWTAEMDVLEFALYETFAAAGWRLPDASAARLRGVSVSPAGISLEWGAEAHFPPAAVEEITAAGTPSPFDEAEGLLARGDFAGALSGYRGAARVKGGDWHAERRVLELLLASAGALPDVETQAARLAQRWPDLAQIALGRAVAAAERGDPAGAAQAYERVADGAERAHERDDADLARVAAAREWLVAGKVNAARPLLETVLSNHPDDQAAGELFAACTTGLTTLNGFATSSATELRRIEEESAAPPTVVEPVKPPRAVTAEYAAVRPVTTQPMTKLAVAIAEADHAETGGRLEAAADALGRALELAGDGAERAELSRRLAAVCDRRGDEEGALEALRTFLANAAPGLAVAPAWRRLVELYARRGDPQAAARALIASADDERTGSADKDRASALVAAAEILRRRVGLAGDAAVLLERAIAIDPRSPEALDALEAIAVEAGDRERLADVLERKIDVSARGPVEQKDLLVRLADVYDEHLGRPEKARDAHQRALGIDAGFLPSLLWLARDAWVRGDDAAARERYAAAVTPEREVGLRPPEREEAHVRLGTLARRAGDDGAAEREAELALAASAESPAGLDLLLDIFEAQARHAELAEVLGRRAAGDLAPAARAALVRRQAAALERAGQVGAAAVLLRGLAESDPAARPALERLAESVRAGGDRAALAAVLEPLGEVLTVSGDLDEADRVLAARIELAPDAQAAAALSTERARLKLLGSEGAAAALAVLREVPVSALPEEGLVLRADLGERQGSGADALPALEELLARARAAGQTFAAQEMEARIAELAGRTKDGRTAGAAGDGADAGGAGGTGGAGSLADLEEALTTDPTDAGVAEELAGMYGQIDDPRHRAEALSGLLRRALGLSPERRKAIYAAMGASAEASGDLERAEKAYWRAATIEAEPALRANFLVAHARVLLARGEVQTAMTELEEAIARVPHHAGALAVLADLTFRTQDYARSRQLYAELDAAPDAADVVPRELLVHRRAVLAEQQGDISDAEAFYRELAILSPRHAEARRALADIALRRGDFGAAALRLEEVLRLLPLDALDRLLDVRQSLGSVYVQLGDWGSARYYLELVLAQDPSRLAALELLVEVYERLALYRDAAQACGRLSRLYFEPARRAAILYRQGEILANHLRDEAGALEAFLKSSDLDPRFVPTMVRLIRHYWAQGDWNAISDLAGDLAAAGYTPGDDVQSAVHLAVGSALAARPVAKASAGSKGGSRVTKVSPAPRPRWRLDDYPFDAGAASRLLAEAAARAPSTPEALDALLAPLVDWGGGTTEDLERAIATAVGEDPADVGALRALTRLSERGGRDERARAALALLVFLDPADAAGPRLAALGMAPAAATETLRVGGAADHPALSGPLRRALAGLSGSLLGFGADGETLAPPGDAAVLALLRAAELRRLGETLGAPAFAAVVDAHETDRASVIVTPTRPATLAVTAAAANLPERAWAFLAARALDELRSGLAGVRGLGAAEIADILRGALAALTGEAAEGERAEAVARWLTDAGAAAALPGGAARERLVEDVRAAVAEPPADWEAFVEAAQDTANRVGLLACRSPSDALAALASDDVLLSQADAAASGVDARRGFLRTGAVRELVRFMLSPQYREALAAEE